MDFVLASDNNYFKHLATSIISIFKSNVEAENVNIHVLSNGIKKENELALVSLSDKFPNSQVIIYDMNNLDDKIGIKVNIDHLSIAAYARLFIPEILPLNVKRAIYLDVDTLVVENLEHLFTIDMKNNVIAAVRSLYDLNPNKHKDTSEFYINSGVILFDLEKCREYKIVNEFIECIKNNNGKLKFHDQTVINETLTGNILELHPKYNVMTPVLLLSYKKFLRFYKLTKYYDEEKFNYASAKPSIVHMTGWIVGRVWEEGSIHPFKNLYVNYLNELNLNEVVKYPAVKSKAYYKFLLFIARNLPLILLKIVKKIEKSIRLKL